jgi:hypothetical protein
MTKLSEREKLIRQKLKDDFPHFATKCLKIRTKEGQILPFTLNRAQLYIHAKLEEQKAMTGKVRALILKGRQQGCCFSPDMKVFTSDYRWVPLSDVKIGDELIACDEETYGKTKAGRKHSRKFRTAKVEAMQEFYKEVYELVFDNGTILKVTGDHRLLFKKRGGCEGVWRHVEDAVEGDEVRIVARTPNYNTQTYEDGWFAGIIDGEGSWRGKNGGSKRLSVHQIDNEILQRIKKYLNDRNISYCEVIDYRTKCGQNHKLGEKPVHRIDLHRLPYLMEIFARCRPTRFTNDKWYEGHELPGKAAKTGMKPWAKLISKRKIGYQKVIDLQTTTKTFICEGVVSHNSTLVGGRFYHQVIHRFGTQAFILTHALDATNNLYKMAQRYYENTPNLIKPEVTTSNAKELIFGRLDSGYKLGTAENQSVGRSATIQLLHGSEVAFWNHASEHAKGIFQAVPNASGTEIVLESTANGVGNFFHQQWQKAEAGESEYIAIFVPWFWQDEYQSEVPIGFAPTVDEEDLMRQYRLTLNQIAWRRNKIAEFSVNGTDGVKSFMQEYPCISAEAFQLTGEDSYVPNELVLRARKTEQIDDYGHLVVGVDPARFGSDRSAIIRRKGRKAFGLQTYVKKDTMEIVGIVNNIIVTEQPAKVFVDIGGLGAGIVDRLKELGHGQVVIGVNAGSTPLDGRKYSNKRSEMWGELKSWLEDEPCQIPDSDELHSDICGTRYKIDSNSRLVMEKKEEMKKRGIRSSDCADALCLTFALPITQITNSSKTSQTAGKIMGKQRTLLNAKGQLYGNSS